MRLKYIRVSEYDRLKLTTFPNFSASDSVIGMEEKHYGKDALLVKCGSYIYNVTDEPDIYYNEAY